MDWTFIIVIESFVTLAAVCAIIWPDPVAKIHGVPELNPTQRVLARVIGVAVLCLVAAATYMLMTRTWAE